MIVSDIPDFGLGSRYPDDMLSAEFLTPRTLHRTSDRHHAIL